MTAREGESDGESRRQRGSSAMARVGDIERERVQCEGEYEREREECEKNSKQSHYYTLETQTNSCTSSNSNLEFRSEPSDLF